MICFRWQKSTIQPISLNESQFRSLLFDDFLRSGNIPRSYNTERVNLIRYHTWCEIKSSSNSCTDITVLHSSFKNMYLFKEEQNNVTLTDTWITSFHTINILLHIQSNNIGAKLKRFLEHLTREAIDAKSVYFLPCLGVLTNFFLDALSSSNV